MIEGWQKIYLVSWLLTSTASVIYLGLHFRTVALFETTYWKFLLVRWKVISFLISGSAIVFLGRFTIDYTWDPVDGAIMSVLTYFTAPWAVATLYFMLKGRTSLAAGFVAIVVYLFSASWCYDGYLIIRDGNYPATWWPNLILSSLLYFSAGILWNLDYVPNKGVVLSFREENWPEIHEKRGVFFKIIWVALPFMATAAWLTIGFLRIFHS